MKSRLVPLLALAALALAAGACKKVTAPAPVDTKVVVARPADLMIELSLPTLDGGLAGVGAYADKIQPGLSGLFKSKVPEGLAEIAGLDGLAGAKGDAPVWLLAMNPKPKGERNALLVTVGDAAKLRESAKKGAIRIQGGFALLGHKEAVEALAPYAFATVAPRKPAPVPLVSASARVVLDAFGKDIEEAKGTFGDAFAQMGQPGMAKMANLEIDGFLALLAVSETIELRIDASADTAAIDLSVVPRAGTPFAGFVGAQEPLTLDLLGRLPADTSPALVLAAKLHVGPLREALVPFLRNFTLESVGLEDNPEVLALFDDLYEAANGSMALTAHLGEGGLRIQQLAGVKDGARGLEQVRGFVKLLAGGGARTTETMGVKSTMTVLPDLPAHDGVSLIGYETKIDVSASPPAVAEAQKRIYPDGLRTIIGGFDDLLVLNIGATDAKVMGGVIDAARGKAPGFKPPAGMSALLEAAAKRGDNAVILIDVVGMQRMAGGAGDAGAPRQSAAVMAFGCYGGAAHLRLEMPMAHLQEVRAAAGK